VVRDASDVLDELFGIGAGPAPTATIAAEPGIDPVERRLLDAVESSLDLEGPATFAGLPVSETRAALARLEARGLVRRDGLFGWQRAR
jgi:predicted Rossmann fold nucleotide-binding protein DprA/Smf involved in DNA uptake